MIHFPEEDMLTDEIKSLKLDITNLSEEQKAQLRGAIKFFSGEKWNVNLFVVDSGVLKPCGALYLTDKVKGVFEDIVGKENVKLDWTIENTKK